MQDRIQDRIQDRRSSIEKAQLWTSQNYVIFDTEATGLAESDQIPELAIIDTSGASLIDSLIRPYRMRTLPGIITEKTGTVRDMPKMLSAWPEIFKIARERAAA